MTGCTMENLIVWYRLDTPFNSFMTKLPLNGVKDLNDIRKAIKMDFQSKLSTCDASDLIINAQWRDKSRPTKKVRLGQFETIDKIFEYLESVDNSENMEVDSIVPPNIEAEYEEEAMMKIRKRFSDEIFVCPSSHFR